MLPPGDGQQLNHSVHNPWVKWSHWIVTLSFLLLLFSGIAMLRTHPRLYLGEVGNDLTPALLELPISRNYKHGGWEKPVPFFNDIGSPVSASRTYEIFNQNSWGRSLHFLMAWFLIIAGVAYVIYGIFSRHLARNILPRRSEISLAAFLKESLDHVRLKVRAPTGGPQYGLLQKSAYTFIIAVAFPLTVITGLGMSPAITATFPFLTGMFGGFQSARTIHFFASVALALFLIIHLCMVIRSGFMRQMKGMITDYPHESKKDINAP